MPLFGGRAACLTALSLALAITGCGGSTIRTMVSTQKLAQVPVVGVVSSGQLADAVTVELAAKAIRVIERSRLDAILDELKLNEGNILVEPNLKRFGKVANVDAILLISAKTGEDGDVDTATARIVDVETGTILVAVSYQNAWGGQRGSVADRVMRHSLPTTATKVAEVLAAAFGK